MEQPQEAAPSRRVWRWRSIVALLFLALLFALHRPLLRGLGNLLIVQDDLVACEAMFVLSGNAFDRGREAAKLHEEGWAERIVCLGGEENPSLQLYGIHELSWQATRRVLLDQGIGPAAIDSLPKGTSTFEELQAIIDYCHARDLKRIMVVSSLFHTRRIDEFCRIRLRLAGIQMVLRGAPESAFREQEWWQQEAGLIFLSNEYIKLGWYWLRY